MVVADIWLTKIYTNLVIRRHQRESKRTRPRYLFEFLNYGSALGRFPPKNNGFEIPLCEQFFKQVKISVVMAMDEKNSPRG